MSIVFGKKYTPDTIDTLLEEASALKASVQTANTNNRIRLKDNTENGRIEMEVLGSPEFLERVKQRVKSQGWKPVVSVKNTANSYVVPRQNSPNYTSPVQGYYIEDTEEKTLTHPHSGPSPKGQGARFNTSESNVERATARMNQLKASTVPTNVSALEKIKRKTIQAFHASRGAEGAQYPNAVSAAGTSTWDATIFRAYALFDSKMNEQLEDDLQNNLLAKAELDDEGITAVANAYAAAADTAASYMFTTMNTDESHMRYIKDKILTRYLLELIQRLAYEKNMDIVLGKATFNPATIDQNIMTMCASIVYFMALQMDMNSFTDWNNTSLAAQQLYNATRGTRSWKGWTNYPTSGGGTRKRGNLHKKRRTRNRKHKNRRTH
jgi:hypothetical protein